MDEKNKAVADLKATIAAKETAKRELERAAFALFAERIDALQSDIDRLNAELIRLKKGE